MLPSPNAEDNAKQTAKMIVELFQTLLKLMEPKPDPEKLATIIRLAFVEPKKLEDLLVQGYLEAGSPPGEIEIARTYLEMAQNQPRNFFGKIVAKELPPGTPGRKKILTSEVKKSLVELYWKLLPALLRFVVTHSRTSKRSPIQVLEFLEADFPEGCAYLIAHCAGLESLISDQRFLRSTRTIEGKAKLLASGMAGKAFGLSPSYAVREIRSAISSQNRNTK